jgi:TonB family protein
MKIEMDRDTINCLGSFMNIAPPPPPPPPPSTGVNIKDSNDGPPPLIVLDGVISDVDMNSINPQTIESINVLKDKPGENQYPATKKYGDKGKNGVIEITTKPVNKPDSKEDLFVVVEELPAFPGGGPALKGWISSNLKYPGEAVKKNITGMVDVGFIVGSNGKIKGVQVIKPVNPLLDAEAVRVVSGMPDWKPGSQHGKKVDVQMKVGVEFKLQ